MDFSTAVRTCFQKYGQFEGRATRPEYWWFVLFLVVCSAVLGIIDGAIFGFGEDDPQLLNSIFGLVTLLPILAAGARRLHDIGRSGWWLLLNLIPIVGTIILIVWLATKSQVGDNEYGPATQHAHD